TAADYFCYSDNDTNITDFAFMTTPAPYGNAGNTAPTSSFSTRLPSHHEAESGTNYYIPASDFHELIGCPLNGEWKIQICDNWQIDNGWIFSWSLDFCGISAGGGCEYQVGIDSVIWEPDSAYGDFDLGRWRGLNIEKRTDTRSIISAHDTAGYFPINVRIYDEFGCEWDTTTAIRSVWAPTPTLGNDTVLCDVETLLLDAKDRHTDTNYIFAWEPFGQNTDTVETRGMMGSSTLYTVAVTHKEWKINCPARDSIRVNINHQPLPNFDPGVYPLEGCEPYTIHFENTSQYGDYYFWDFGDGDTSSAKSPTHTYGTGQYNFRYIVSTEHGCRDSLVYEDLVTVYSSPVAQFSWEPMNPTVMHPEVTFNNLTIPQSDENKYYWEIQYDRDNKVSYHTLRDVNPTFQWETDGSDISGNYVVRLIAMTENLGPSGNIVECRDTIENSILLVNDFLQFPSAVTPNGDGYNDKFIIRNLLEGLGYPNNSLAIYDRWGKRIFYKENISKEEDFWDPAADNTPTGTYFWRFTGKGYLGDIQRNGVVEVIK
ncbi:MAG: gliding motility-associated C-terminal domain-containing protein, partial [Bacteroidales bacterium]|nr:gliding motility-associated C-terminal domain-containing protein [Bacteroidales bacterium]